MEVNEPAVSYSRQKYTIEEYLEMENAATTRSEYYKGDIFAMSGVKPPHYKVCSNLMYRLHQKLEGRGCAPYGADTRIHIEANSLFTYPDISVICGEMEMSMVDPCGVLTPVVLIEAYREAPASTTSQQSSNCTVIYPHCRDT